MNNRLQAALDYIRDHKPLTPGKHTNKSRIGSGIYTMRKIKASLDVIQCNICLNTFKASNIQIDHIIPVCDNGSSCIDNLQFTCKQCNTIKSMGDNRSAIEVIRSGNTTII